MNRSMSTHYTRWRETLWAAEPSSADREGRRWLARASASPTRFATSRTRPPITMGASSSSLNSSYSPPIPAMPGCSMPPTILQPNWPGAETPRLSTWRKPIPPSPSNGRASIALTAQPSSMPIATPVASPLSSATQRKRCSSRLTGNFKYVWLGFTWGSTTDLSTGNVTSKDNNGNLWTQQIINNDSTNLNVMQQFEYDAYNRLSFAVETPTSLAPTLSSTSTCSSLSLTAPNEDPWCQQYGYDAFGNRWVTNWSSGSNGYPISTVTPTSSSWYSSSNNRLSTTAPGVQYDNNAPSSPGGNGNLTGLGGFAYLFDAENRMTQSTINSAITTYFYDGAGRRVNKTTGNTSTTYVYDATGGLVAEYGNAPMENGGPQPAGTQYLTDDHLGSTRLVTDALGNPQKRYDYLPFGEDIPQGLDGCSMTMYGPPLMPGPTEDTVNNKFTGKERDAESGLD